MNFICYPAPPGPPGEDRIVRVDVLWNSFGGNALPSVWRTIFRAHEPDAADMFVAIEGDTPGDRRILIFDLGIGLSPQRNRAASFARTLRDAWREACAHPSSTCGRMRSGRSSSLPPRAPSSGWERLTRAASTGRLDA